MAALPSLKSAVICDQAIQEAGTGKWSLIGLFDQILVPVPTGKVEETEAEFKKHGGIAHPQLAVYFCIADARGSYPFQVQIVRLTEEMTPIASLDGSFDAKDMLKTTALAVNIRGLRLPAFGRYLARLLIKGVEIGAKEFDVLPHEVPA